MIFFAAGLIFKTAPLELREQGLLVCSTHLELLFLKEET
jgi:hypothetical protein